MKCETCARIENPNLGVWDWKPAKVDGVWGWFFDYHTLEVGRFTYYQRVNKLDRLFHFISSQISKYV